MKLGDIRHNKNLCGERIHLYAIHGRKQIDLFQNWVYLMPECLNGRNILRMSYNLGTGWISVEIDW